MVLAISNLISSFHNLVLPPAQAEARFNLEAIFLQSTLHWEEKHEDKTFSHIDEKPRERNTTTLYKKDIHECHRFKQKPALHFKILEKQDSYI